MAGNLATAYVQVIPSAKGIKGSISNVLSGEAASAGTSAGNTIGTNLGSAFKKAIAAIGIGKILKETFSAAADLQQSVGGIETLYTAADGGTQAVETLEAYAKAAASAGISANTYMEQAVSFGASLKQSLGGDVAKAAEAANTAIMDMADNSAKMGTSIDSIQMAYQGFAKQNYTMLDNLKLGYGGTKEEMERLLTDAQALTGVEYDISNLSDVYSAIHAIQTNLNITGVAAAEAESTFSGSFGAMKASAENLLGAIALGGDISTQLEDFKTKVITFVQGNFLPMLTQIVQNIPTLLVGVLDILTPLVPVLTQAAVDIVSYLSTALINAAPQILTMIIQIGTLIVQTLASVDWGALGTQIVTALQTAIPQITEIIVQLATTIGQVLMSIDWASVASQIMTALGNAFQANPGAAVAGMGVLAVLLGSKLAGGLAPFISKIGSGIGSMVSGLFGKIGGAASSAAGPLSSASSGMSTFSQNALGLVAAGAGIALAAAGLYLLAQAAIQLSTSGTPAAVAMVALVGAMAGMAIGAAVLAPALAAGAVGLVAFGAGIALIGAGIFLATAGLTLLCTQLPTIVAYGGSAATSMVTMSGGLVTFAAGAAAAGAAALVLGAGLLVAGAGAVVAGAGLILVGTGALLAGAGIAVIQASGTAVNAILSRIGGLGTTASAGILVLSASSLTAGASMLVMLAGSAAATVGMVAFAAGIVVATAGAVLLLAGLLGVVASMASIAISAKTAAGSLQEMVTSIDIVDAGLDGIKAAAGTVIDALVNIFTNASGKLASATASITKAIEPFGTALGNLGGKCTVSLVGITAMSAGLTSSAASMKQMAASAVLTVAGLVMIVAATAQVKSGFATIPAAITLTTAAFKLFSTAVTSNTNTVSQSMTKMGTSAQTGVNRFKSALSGIPNAVNQQMVRAASIVSSSLAQMQRAFASTRFTFSRNIALPHFKMNGSFNAQSGQVPTVGVDWYAKGGILTNPTIFGMSGGRLLGGGEAGPEAVAPISALQDYIREAVESSSANYTQNVTINSPTSLTPSEVARQTKNATRRMVLALKGRR